MRTIENQIRKLYASSVLANLSLTGAWVALLAARGFSLVEIGFAETAYHIASLLMEIPSGTLADVFGRKKMLMIGVFIRMIGNVVMILSNGIALVCLTCALFAVCDSFCSGSGDALAFDSLKSAKLEGRYDRYESNQLTIYRLCDGISTLCAGFALVIGYKLAYAVGIAVSAGQLAVLSTLKEIRIDDDDTRRTLSPLKALMSCFKDSVLFLKSETRAVMLMIANSLIGAVDILLLFFLQAKLPIAGIPDRLLGIALFAMHIGGIIGAKLTLVFKKQSYRLVFAAAACLVAAGVALEHTGSGIIMVLGGFTAALADDALQVRTNTKLQMMFPSDRRATLISIDCFTFSLIMIVLSPIAGWFFSIW